MERQKELKTRNFMIYLIGNAERNICKIGFTDDLYSRMKAIQTGCPYKLSLIAAIDGTLKDEKILHKRFAEANLNSEWFSITDGIIKEFGMDVKTAITN